MPEPIAVQSISRPDKKLLTSYIVHSFQWGPAFIYPLVTNIIRYRTLEYKFDDDGITASWGRLSRREVRVNYQAIQDIHLRSDLVERWLGLARIEVQTASGEAAAELVLEGIPQFNELRDFLLQRMQRTLHRSTLVNAPPEPSPKSTVPAADKETMVALTEALGQVAQELRLLRSELGQKPAVIQEVTPDE